MIFSIDAKEKKERTALRTENGTQYSYGELCARTADFARTVRRICGRERTARPLLFILCRNRPGAVIGYLGAIEAGAVPLLLDADLEDTMLERFAAVYRPALIWKPASRLLQTERNGISADGDRTAAFPDGIHGKEPDCGGTVYTACEYEMLFTGERPYPVHPDLTLLLATSGSTGSPKLVRLTRQNLESNAASIAEYLHLTPEERPVTTLPMQYTYGLSVINSHLLAGGCILLADKSIVQQDFWEFLEREQATSLAGVPYTYKMLDRLHFCDRTPGSLRSMTQAGGKLPEALQEKFGSWACDHGVSFYIMYGQTEATARMSYLPPERCLDKIGSIGVPIPGGRFLLEEESGKDGKPDGFRATQPDRVFEAVGELVYEGANVTPGYAESPADLLKGDERGGQLYTGDLAGRDADGYYYIIGRRNRFVKLYGVRVSLDACEQILQRLYPYCEAACTGSDDGITIFLTDETATAESAGRLAEEIRINPRAVAAYFIPELPKNSSGKIRYAALQKG